MLRKCTFKYMNIHIITLLKYELISFKNRSVQNAKSRKTHGRPEEGKRGGTVFLFRILPPLLCHLSTAVFMTTRREYCTSIGPATLQRLESSHCATAALSRHRSRSPRVYFRVNLTSHPMESDRSCARDAFRA